MYIGADSEAVTIISNTVRQINIQTRFKAEKNAWPPEQLKPFTPLLLVHYRDHRTPEEVATMAKLMHSGDFSSVTDNDQPAIKCPKSEKFERALDTSTATKEITDILAPLESKESQSRFILIEGAPGIGKSVLLKEIAYRWGKKQLLCEFDLVLLVCLRDPSLGQIKSVSELLHLFYKGDENAAKLVEACNKYLFKNCGQSLTLLLDGYDEYPKNLKENSLLADILQRKILPCCGLVVSSRPHASVCFHEEATIRVDILGFPETEREHYIKQALSDQPHKIEELTQYLHKHPFVDSICFIPLNMVILIYLYKQGISLPKTTTELYRHFICSTICRHLSLLNNPLEHNITNLTELPEPYNKIIKQLSKLSLDALNNNKLVFTLDELVLACPDIATIPGAINGFGLLQAVQHCGQYTKMMTLNFVHFTIQEFLAADYISHLSPNEELKVIAANFWSSSHLNMFSMYLSLTKAQRPSFKQFLSGGNEEIAISSEFLTKQLKCLYLYYCFNEADDYEMCNIIEQAESFSHKTVDLKWIKLTPNDMECISLFLTSSHNKEWEELNLYNCFIQDIGLNILYRRFRHSSDIIVINKLGLEDNGLTTQLSSLISEFIINCKVKELCINGNYTIGEDEAFYSMLTNPSTMLEELYMYHTKLSSKGANHLFNGLKDNSTLKKLHIHHNLITDDACNALVIALKNNSCLVELAIDKNPLSDEAIINIVQCLKVNNTLQYLWLPGFQDIKNIRRLQEIVNERRNQGCQVKLEN